MRPRAFVGLRSWAGHGPECARRLGGWAWGPCARSPSPVPQVDRPAHDTTSLPPCSPLPLLLLLWRVQIKSRKLHELTATAVPPKYQAGLARLKIKSAGKQ